MAQSGHGSLVAPPQGRAECVGCHEGKAVLKAWNASSHYAEVNSPTNLAITCAVCHDPHGSPRFVVSYPLASSPITSVERVSDVHT